VLIAIFTCAKNSARLNALERTWLPVARGAGYRVQIFDGAYLDVPDTYAFLPLKDRGIFNFALSTGYAGLLKCDDDTFLRISQLVKLPLEAVDYAGARCRANQLGRPCSGGNGLPYEQFPASYPPGTFPHDYAQGGAVWFSRRAISILAEADFNGDWACDRWAGNALAGVGIRLTALPEFVWCGPSTAKPVTPWTRDYVAATQLPTPETLDQLKVNPLCFCKTEMPIPGSANRNTFPTGHSGACHCRWCEAARRGK